MSDEKPTNKSDIGSMRSPVRPRRPEAAAPQRQPIPARPAQPGPEDVDIPDDPQEALQLLRRKMETAANDYAQGRLNRAQFNAVYGRYNEQRMIIERLVERDPNSDAWQHVAAPGHTGFLVQHFQSRPVYYVIFRLDPPGPLMMGGQRQPDLGRLELLLGMLLNLNPRPEKGLARKDMGNNEWLLLALGKYTVTMVLFMLEPSTMQINRVRDLHQDFERANHQALARGTRSLERLVFPQRALVE